ncbi:unnamed protein product [Agarophyton chilense]|eukprot:gb/GEZJ01000560.1/.p1 GENE.gb/GEZJ01000560.1/~~gb/GEZJ01000560.1/.p1  ORF type:complete len:762 (-),score=91.32 gb/GEZJ01000560.1/:1384-3669(-)
MNRRDCPSTYAYAVPLYLSTSWDSRNTRPRGYATIRQSSKSAWLSSPGRRRRSHSVYYHPVCSAKVPKDDENTREQWFSGLKIWFRSKNNKKTKDLEEHDAHANGNANGASKDLQGVSVHKPETTRDENRKNGDEGVRWPWQRDKKDDNEIKKPSSEIEKRKGSESCREAPSKFEGEKGKQLGILLQERIENMTKIIVSGFSQEKESKKMHGNTEKKSECEDNAELEPVKLEETQNTSAHESVRELYQPPINKAEDEGESGEQEESPWFRLPWKRKEDKQTRGLRDVRARGQGKTSRMKPEITPERIDTLEKVDVAADLPREPLSTKPEFTRMKKGEDEQNEVTQPQRGREKESVSLSKSKEAEMNAAIADMMTIPQRDVAEIRLIFGSETFFATETVSMPGGLIFRGNLRGEPKSTIAKLEKKLSHRLGEKYTLCLAEGEEDNRPVVVVVPTARDKRPPAPRQKVVAIIVALMTVSTCIGRGFFVSILRANIRALHGPHPGRNIFNRLFDLPSATSLTVAFAIMIIMLLAQGVQRIVAMRHKTRVALPFFLPSYQLGTFGAVVQIASPTPTRSSLFDIAMAGMVTMVVLSSICLIVGLRMSTTFSAVVPVPMSLVSGSVIIGYLTQYVPDGKILVDYGRSLIGLHPLAVVGANCLTIAALNLLPIRQLDGGRIIGALYGRKTAMMASRVTMLFLLLASSKTPYFIMYLAAMSFGPWSIDRPSKDEITEPNALRTIVGYLFMLLMIGILLPYPASKFFGTI